ncbi:PopZ family protein [Martelella endophytica]|uniref:Pole-organizing protein PopZ n=1 Tax=Martelella endophytica TaxID=1486262 RepID=A0A0D5LSJ1_MAREN|nr:DUF2497 domain-containing protein [Martelella endophytica]AJY46747.1 hypothetical protein TM49_15430 [Martelella endophytica]
MAQPKMQQEPTMEEILASIRRIIDSGEEQGAERGTRGSRYEEPAAELPEAEADEWQTPANRDPVVVSRTYSGEVDMPAAPEAEEPAVADQPEMRETSQAVYPGSLSEVAAQVRAASASEPEAEEVPSADDDALLSSDTERRIGDALRELSAALEQEGARSMEEIVAEELRPLLREWLEEHMPSIVETMVAKEIERMRKR